MSETTTIPGTEVRVGDTVSRTRSGITRTGTVASIHAYTDLTTAEGGYIGHTDHTYTLLHRLTPTLPTVLGSVILASEVRGVVLNPPVALRRVVGDWTRLDEEAIDGLYWHAPEHITAWTPAKIVAVTE